MSDCCSTENTKEKNQVTVCPNCKNKGKAVELMTIKSLLVQDAMKRLIPSPNYYFCRTFDCPIVYFNDSISFIKDELIVPVFQKENSNSTPVCYCFGFNKENIIDDVAKNGKSTIREEVTQYVKDNKCGCEFRNPQGDCCLGNIGQVAKQAQLAKKVIFIIIVVRCGFIFANT